MPTDSPRDPIVPTSEGLWLIIDGSEHGHPVLVHDPTGDGLQFDYDGYATNTNFSAYRWGGRLGVVTECEEEIDTLAFLESTPPGSRRRVTVGDITLEDDRRPQAGA